MYTETGALLQHAAGVEKGKQESGEKTLREGGTGHSDGDGDVTERYSDFSDFSEAAKPDSEATGLREGNNTRIRQISSAETTGDRLQRRADASARCPALPRVALLPCCPALPRFCAADASLHPIVAARPFSLPLGPCCRATSAVRFPLPLQPVFRVARSRVYHSRLVRLVVSSSRLVPVACGCGSPRHVTSWGSCAACCTNGVAHPLGIRFGHRIAFWACARSLLWRSFTPAGRDRLHLLALTCVKLRLWL